MGYLTDTYHNKDLSKLNLKKEFSSRFAVNSTCLGKVIDENNNEYFYKTIKEEWTRNSILGEVLVSYLCKNYLGINCVEATFAEDKYKGKKIEGVLVKSFIEPDVERVFNFRRDIMLDYCKRTNTDESWFDDFLHIDDILKIFNNSKDKLKISKEVELDPNLKTDLLTIALSDFMFGQSDRYSYNLEFLVRNVNGKKVLCSSPMTDNGLSFWFNSNSENKADFHNTIKRLARSNASDEEKRTTYNKFKTPVSMLNAGKHDNIVCMRYPERGLAKEILTNKKLKEIYEKFQLIDIKTALENFERDADFQISEEMKMRIEIVFNGNKELLKETVLEIEPKLGLLQIAEQKSDEAMKFFIKEYNLRSGSSINSAHELDMADFKKELSAYGGYVAAWHKWAMSSDRFDNPPRLSEFCMFNEYEDITKASKFDSEVLSINKFEAANINIIPINPFSYNGVQEGK